MIVTVTLNPAFDHILLIAATPLIFQAMMMLTPSDVKMMSQSNSEPFHAHLYGHLMHIECTLFIYFTVHLLCMVIL